MINFARQFLYGLFDDIVRITDITIQLMPDDWRFMEPALFWTQCFFEDARDYVN